MDRFYWSNKGIEAGETKSFCQNGVRIYDGDQKTSYDDGVLTLTSHKLMWMDSSNSQICISLSLSLAVFCERHGGGIGKSAKVSLHLQPVPQDRLPGPVARSSFGFIRFAFKHGGDVEFNHKMEQAIHNKAWEKSLRKSSHSTPEMRPLRASGIIGIERKMEAEKKMTDQSISVAFKDLTKLMEKAKEMVTLSSTIAEKIKDKKGDITDDETVKFQSYLLSLGIPNPVTKQTHGSGTHYHQQLAHEIARSLKPQIEKSGGMILLTDAYCRINRARGMELLSPEDLLNACRVLSHLNLSIKLRQFDTGVMVLQLDSHSDETVVKQTTELVTDSNSLSSEELASLVDISVLLAKERLLLAESSGAVCRDDADQGLRFYPNLFLTKSR
uniref:Vacuolar protein-sorting-associated protein 36 n=1 Tax=Ciona savignyi TaxID=51511 RepID=H2YLK5_CIOSA